MLRVITKPSDRTRDFCLKYTHHVVATVVRDLQESNSTRSAPTFVDYNNLTDTTLLGYKGLSFGWLYLRALNIKWAGRNLPEIHPRKDKRVQDSGLVLGLEILLSRTSNHP